MSLHCLALSPYHSVIHWPCLILLKLMDFSKLLHGFVNIDKWISLNYYNAYYWYMDFSKVVTCFSWPLPKKTKLKVHQDFKACWSFCFEPKVLKEPKCSMPWVLCAFTKGFGDVLYRHIVTIVIFILGPLVCRAEDGKWTLVGVRWGSNIQFGFLFHISRPLAGALSAMQMGLFSFSLFSFLTNNCLFFCPW